MRVEIFSDLHVDVFPIKPITIVPGVDLVIVAGDVCEGALRAFEHLRRLVPMDLPIVMVMGNHGILVIGDNVADAFNRMFYFERAAETYIKALWTGRPLRTLSDEVAEKAAREMDDYPGQAERHFADLKAILDEQEPVYRS